MTGYTPTDSIKHLANAGRDHLDYAIDQIGQMISAFAEGLTEDRADELQSILESVHGMITEALEAHTQPEERNRYADGRAVATRLELEPGNVYVHSRHPDPEDRLNQPHQIGPHRCTSGALRTVVVNAGQCLGVIHEPRLRMVRGGEQ